MTPTAAVTEAVAVAAEAAGAKATEQENDENNDEYESDRHDLSPNNLTKAPTGSPALLRFDGNTPLADVDLDAGGLLPLLVELIAEDQSDHGQHADDEVESIAIHNSRRRSSPRAAHDDS